MLINGTTVTVTVAHVRLCNSRRLFARAYPRETQEMVFDAHDRVFAFFKDTRTRATRADGRADFRSGTSQPCHVCWPVRGLPCSRGVGVEDLPGAVRQEQILGVGALGRATGGDPRLCRSDRNTPGRPGRRRSPSRLSRYMPTSAHAAGKEKPGRKIMAKGVENGHDSPRVTNFYRRRSFFFGRCPLGCDAPQC